MKHKKIITLSILIFTIILLSGGAYFLNRYLKQEYLFFYAIGTNEKAFLNSTWKMSPKEVERANNVNLILFDRKQSKSNPFIAIFAHTLSGMLIHDNRVKEFTSVDKIKLFGEDIELILYFFDNKLFRYNVFFSYIYQETIDDVYNNLTRKFGKELTKQINKHTNTTILKWENYNKNIYYLDSINTEEIGELYLIFEYRPFVIETIETIEKEKRDYF